MGQYVDVVVTAGTAGKRVPHTQVLVADGFPYNVAVLVAPLEHPRVGRGAVPPRPVAAVQAPYAARQPALGIVCHDSLQVLSRRGTQVDGLVLVDNESDEAPGRLVDRGLGQTHVLVNAIGKSPCTRGHEMPPRASGGGGPVGGPWRSGAAPTT